MISCPECGYELIGYTFSKRFFNCGKCHKDWKVTLTAATAEEERLEEQGKLVI